MEKKVYFVADGTTCGSCAKIIMKTAKKIAGVKEVHYSYEEDEGYVVYDSKKVHIDKIFSKISKKGYDCEIINSNTNNHPKHYAWLLILIGAIVVLYFIFGLADRFNLPELTQGMSLGLLFLVGLFTGFHCVGMCGGFVVSYSMKKDSHPHWSHFKYGFGKTLSYTIIGALFGLLGSFIAFTPFIRGMAGLLAGLFLIIFGLKMLNIFPWLRKFTIRTPKFIIRLLGKESSKHSNSPLIIGLLNGLMIACGPLQAIYVLAAGTGSMLEGAKMLFVFGLGTLPVLLGFGYLTSRISNKTTHNILKASGVLVIILGIIMLNRGLALTGTGYDITSMVSKTQNSFLKFESSTTSGSATVNIPGAQVAELKGNYQEIRMDVTYRGWQPNKFVLQKGVPVKWIINGKEISGCNNAIQVPSYNLNFPIKRGGQIIEFTPDKEGVVSWSCWMGMIRGSFIVREDLNFDDQEVAQLQQTTSQPLAQGSCSGSSGGGCGCGGGY